MMRSHKADIAPPINVPVLDVPHMHDARRAFAPDTEVVAVEKINGYQMRVVWVDRVLYVGSRTRWYDAGTNNVFWRAAEQYREFLTMLRVCDRVVFYFEVYGEGVCGNYHNVPDGKLRLAFIDSAVDGSFTNEVRVPVSISFELRQMEPAMVWRGAFKDLPLGVEKFTSHADPTRSVAAEGVVVRAVQRDAVCPFTGERMMAKIVRSDFLSRTPAGADN